MASAQVEYKDRALKSLPVPQPADLLKNQRPYTVGPFDRLVIDVFDVPGLAMREVQADSSGRISFPLIGVVEVVGLTPSQIEVMLRAKLQEKSIRAPDVTVNLKETGAQFVTVFGEVQSPGLYPVVGRMTLLMAIAKAQGTTELSRLDNILVYRWVNGERYAAMFNIKNIKRGKYEDPEIYPNDVLIVDNSAARRLFKDFLSVAPLFLPVAILALQ